jgi:hypothetical protein
MSENSTKTPDDAAPKPKRRHPYFMENTPEETLRRMETLPQRVGELRKRLEAAALSETSSDAANVPPQPKKPHPYFSENTPEEALRRMKSFPERAAKFKEKLEKLKADRKTDTP